MTNKWCQSCSVLRTAAAVHISILKFPKVGLPFNKQKKHYGNSMAFSEGSLWNDLLQWLFPGFSSFLDGFLLLYSRINLYWLVVSTNPSEKSWTSSVGIMIIPNWMDKFTKCSKIWKSVGMMTFPIYGKIKFMFQTVRQLGWWHSYMESHLPHVPFMFQTTNQMNIIFPLLLVYSLWKPLLTITINQYIIPLSHHIISLHH